MDKELYNTPNLDELENGPWPSFVTGLKRLAQDDHEGASMVRDVLATLETSYVTKKGFYKRRNGRCYWLWWWCNSTLQRA